MIVNDCWSARRWSALRPYLRLRAITSYATPERDVSGPVAQVGVFQTSSQEVA
jgi:hypothetical protein